MKRSKTSTPTKTYKRDFSFARLNLVLEVKPGHRPDREKDIIAEINGNIRAYKQKHGNLLFVICDIGHIRDVYRFSQYFEKQAGVMIRIVKH